MGKQFTSILTGVLFILVGVLLLLDRYGIFEFSWTKVYPVILLVLSGFSFASVARGNKHSSFWGTVFGVSGIFVFLRNYDIVDYFWYGEIWPVIVLSFGLGFIVLYFFQSYDWGVLIPGGILTFLGIIMVLDTFDVPIYTIETIKDFWPLILVLVGSGLIISSLKHKTKEEPLE
ncbi:MAG: hypothetical protein GWP06_08330 [Actinobacteria bacterium]|nr:hypothetical protein [Actinomycetota bacterium]